MGLNSTARRWSGSALALLLMLCGLLAVSPVAAAAPSAASAGTLTLALLDGPSYPYGSGPSFSATVVLAAKPTYNYFMQVVVHLDTGQTLGNANSPTVSPDGLTYTFHISSLGTVIPVGDHTAYATFLVGDLNTTLQSDSVSFTISKGTASLNCTLTGMTLILTPGQTITVDVTTTSINSTTSVDWPNATYTIAFIGTSTFTAANLTPSSNDTVTFQAPTQVGRYQIQCTFNGTGLFNPVTVGDGVQQILVSEENKLGGADLYTNPATLVARQPIEMYVVFHPAPGLPAPTGYFNVDFGREYTTATQIGSNGATLFQVQALPDITGVDAIRIDYQGDEHYNSAVFAFTLTNPAIPGSGGGNGSGGGTGHGLPPTATVRPSASATPTSTSAATPSATHATSGPSTTPPDPARPSQTGIPGWLFGIVTVILCLNLGGAAVILVSRRRFRSPVSTQ